MYVKQKRYDELTIFLKGWLDKAPDDPQRHYRLGIIYEFKKEYDLAVAEYKKSIELQPDNARMLMALGRTYMKTGRLSEAREMLELSKKADPTLTESQLLLNSIIRDPQPIKKKLRKKAGTKKPAHKNTPKKK